MIELLIVLICMFILTVIIWFCELFADWLYDDEPVKSAKETTKRKSNTKKAS